MAIYVHTATRADAIVAPLAQLLAMPVDDPMAPEVVGIPTRGMERWLAQQLAQSLGARAGRRDGVSANIDFRFLGSLIGRILAPRGTEPSDDPWRPERAVWRLLEVVETAANPAEFGPLLAHIGRDGGDRDDVRRGRRYGALRHVADLFDRYAMHRPEMIRAWAAGGDVDGSGRPLVDELRWQPRLWRAVHQRIGVPSLPERLETECARIRADPDAVDVPSRLAIVGVSRIPATYLRVLRALVGAREIHLFVLHPSPALWEAVRAGGPPDGPTRRADDPTVGLAAHPLLATWGRDVREMQLILAGAVGRRLDSLVETEPASLLGRLQADIRANRPPVEGARGPRELPLGDRSVQVHSCHGRARQVEVLRDAVLHLLQADPTLEPRDVLVLCPDIEVYAPLIEATFGVSGHGADGTGAPLEVAVGQTSVPVEVADRSLRATNPLIAAVAQVMTLAVERITSTQVLGLAALDPVRRRFGFTDDDLVRVERLALDAGIRWGLDAAGRSPFAVGDVAANTWRSGIDRMLMGVAVGDADDELVGGVTPLGALDVGAIDLVGRLAEFVDRLALSVGRLAHPQPVSQWVDAIVATADLLTDVDPTEAWQRAQLAELLAELDDDAGPLNIEITAREMRGILGSGAHTRSGSARYRTGRVTVSSMIPMRGVPSRVVCLLGLDDGAFPRSPGSDGDDIMMRDPLVGDRDPRGDDLQQLLDAVMSATDHLIVTYAGHNARTNLAQPPAVPIAELLDTLDRMVIGTLDRRVLVEHPLQPFDPRNFRAGDLAPGVVWSFDPVAAAGARALVAGPGPKQPFLQVPLPPIDDTTIELSALLRFVEHPIREFLSARLGLRLRRVADELPDDIPVDLAGLEKWAVGDRMLRAARRRRDVDVWAASEMARGTLPPGRLGERVLEEIAPAVREIAAEAAACQGDRVPRSVSVEVPLADGRRIVGSVDQVFDELVLSAGYGRLSPKARLQAWTRLLVLSAMDPSRGYRSVVIGRNPDPRRPANGTASIDPPDPTSARDGLQGLVAIYDAGMCSVPMIFTRTSAAYAEGVLGRPKPRQGTSHLAGTWDRSFGSPAPGESEDPAYVLVLGGKLDFTDLWSRHGDALRSQATRLWADLIAAERRSF